MAMNKIGLLDKVDSLIDSSQVNSTEFFGLTQEDIQAMIPEVMRSNWENLSVSLSEWQKSQLPNVEERGIKCLPSMWFMLGENFVEGTYCNATWDKFYCWPPTPAGSVVTLQCSEILKDTGQFPDHLKGSASRVCSDGGTWLWDNWTNYNQCADS